MTKTFCDRCGAEIEQHGSFFKAVHTHIVDLEDVGEPEESAIDLLLTGIKNLTASITGEKSDIENTHFELCPECAKQFYNWIHDTELITEED